MQLSILVDFCRALGDPARLRIIHILARGPARGVELAGLLGLTPATVSHHMTKLRETGIIRESREGNSTVYSMDESGYKEGISSLGGFLDEAKESSQEGVDKGMEEMHARQMEKEIRPFLDKDNRLKSLPVKFKRKLMVLEHMVSVFEPGVRYSEEDVNLRIMGFHEDYSTIRREFIVNRFMYRENGIYEMNPKEMWMDWRKLK